jgi:hypothetical protein
MKERAEDDTRPSEPFFVIAGRDDLIERMKIEIPIGRRERSMKIGVCLFIVIILSGLSGCASHTVRLRNDSDETVQCEGRGEEVDACVNKYEAAGYKPVEEPRRARGLVRERVIGRSGGSPGAAR